MKYRNAAAISFSIPSLAVCDGNIKIEKKILLLSKLPERHFKIVKILFSITAAMFCTKSSRF